MKNTYYKSTVSSLKREQQRGKSICKSQPYSHQAVCEALWDPIGATGVKDQVIEKIGKSELLAETGICVDLELVPVSIL